MAVVDGPQLGQVLRPHRVHKVLPPHPLKLDQACVRSNNRLIITVMVMVTEILLIIIEIKGKGVLNNNNNNNNNLENKKYNYNTNFSKKGL